MTIIEHNNEIEIIGVRDFDLEKTFECGQCFRWSANQNGVYTGVAFSQVAELCTDIQTGSIFISGTIEDFKNIWCDYFDLNRDYLQIRQDLCIDDFMIKATEFGAGIRILRQDKWEALCSFIISQNNHIPRIRSIIDNLCKQFGDKIKFKDRDYYTFPSAEKINTLHVKDLANIRSGYRADYIIRAARDIADGKINLEELANRPSDEARKELKKLHGVGDKVADCVMLFGLNKLDAFPLDVWMKRAVTQHYGSGFDPQTFSPFAGIAQQYIFYYMREHGSNRWGKINNE